MKLKNDLFLQCLRGEKVSRPAVWMMRQAGRYLPDYMVLREKYPSFFTRCKTPELVADITTMPVRQIGVDAAILFSDILVLPQALGFDITINEGEGPRVHNKIESPEQALQVKIGDIADQLHYVMEGIKATQQSLDGDVPLIGFAGAPWTIFCYVLEGKGSKDFNKAKQFYLQHPAAAQHLMQTITDATAIYLNEQIKAGVHAVQLFDSWAGMLSPSDFEQWAMPFYKQIIEKLDKKVPFILFAKGAWHSLDKMSDLQVNALGIDWLVSADFARKQTNNKVVLQGNYDPAHLLGVPKNIEKEVKQMITDFGTQKYIANLGHGILPNVPVDNAKAFVNAVKNYH